MIAPDERTPSAFLRMIGAKLEEFGEGYSRISLVLEEKHTNPNGVMHGGVATSLMDEASGGAIVSIRGMEAMMQAPHATVDMNTSFLAGPRIGDEIVVEGRALRVGRSVAGARATSSPRGGLRS